MAELRDGMTVEQLQVWQAFQADRAMLELIPKLIREVESDEEAQEQATLGREIIRRHKPRLDSYGIIIASAALGRTLGRPIGRFAEALAKRLS